MTSNFKKINTICFDLDNTLVSLKVSSQLAFQNTLLTHGKRLRKELCHIPSYKEFQMVQQSFDASQEHSIIIDPNQWRNNCFRTLVSRHGGSIELVDLLTKTYSTERKKPVSLETSVADLLRFLRELTASSLGVLTNGFTNLSRNDRAHFCWFIRAFDLQIKKPSSHFFEQALKIMNRKPKEILYVSDSFKNDARGAHWLGIPVAIINPVFENTNSNFHFLNSFDELISFLCKKNKIDTILSKQRRVLIERKGLKDSSLEPFIKRLRDRICLGIVWVAVENANNQKLLLVRRNKAANWGFLSGEVERGETWKLAAIRELKEEVNLSPNHLEILAYVTLRLFSTNHQIEVPGRLIKVTLSSLPTNLSCSSELSEAKFFSHDNIPSKMFSQNEKFIPFVLGALS